MAMDNKQAIEVIRALREERTELENELKALDSFLSRFERRNSSVATPQLESNVVNILVKEPNLFSEGQAIASKTKGDNNFPKTAAIGDQILYVLNALGKANRYPEIQEEYTNLSGSKRAIRKDLQELRRTGSLVAIKYNNNSTQVYQGLPHWVIENENGPLFKEEFIDINSNSFPTGVWKYVKMDEEKI